MPGIVSGLETPTCYGPGARTSALSGRIDDFPRLGD